MRVIPSLGTVAVPRKKNLSLLALLQQQYLEMYQPNQRYHGRGRPVRVVPPSLLQMPLFPRPPHGMGFFPPQIPARAFTLPVYGGQRHQPQHRPDMVPRRAYHHDYIFPVNDPVIDPVISVMERTGQKRHNEDTPDSGHKRRRRESHNESSLTQIPDVPVPPPDYSRNSSITQAIVENFVRNHQTQEVYGRKLQLRDALHAVLSGLLPNCGLYIVGSSMSGFSTKSSDIDLCLVVSEKSVDQRREAVDFLYMLSRALNRCSFLSKFLVVRAVVPILKVYDMVGEIEVDLNINNIVGIRNTHLLKYYSLADWRVCPLILFIKKWARFHDINDASKSTLSSYSLSLMLIHYLQCGTSPPVLPVLQKMYPDLFSGEKDIRTLRFDADIDFKSKNEESLGDLFLGFLSYYANSFDYTADCASVRLGLKIRRPEYRNACCAIEEPFDHSNTARSCYESETFERVKRVFRASYKRLNEKRNVDCLFQNPF